MDGDKFLSTLSRAHFIAERQLANLQLESVNHVLFRFAKIIGDRPIDIHVGLEQLDILSTTMGPRCSMFMAVKLADTFPKTRRPAYVNHFLVDVPSFLECVGQIGARSESWNQVRISQRNHVNTGCFFQYWRIPHDRTT